MRNKDFCLQVLSCHKYQKGTSVFILDPSKPANLNFHYDQDLLNRLKLPCYQKYFFQLYQYLHQYQFKPKFKHLLI